MERSARLLEIQEGLLRVLGGSPRYLGVVVFADAADPTRQVQVIREPVPRAKRGLFRRKAEGDAPVAPPGPRVEAAHVTEDGHPHLPDDARDGLRRLGFDVDVPFPARPLDLPEGAGPEDLAVPAELIDDAFVALGAAPDYSVELAQAIDDGDGGQVP